MKSSAPKHREPVSKAKKRNPLKAAPGFNRLTAAKAQHKHNAIASLDRKERHASDWITYTSPVLTLICLPPGPKPRRSLASLSACTGVHPDLLKYYCRIGLLDGHSVPSGDAQMFDDEAVDEVRRIEHYRRDLGVTRDGLPLVCQLWHQSQRQQIELFFLRCP